MGGSAPQPTAVDVPSPEWLTNSVGGWALAREKVGTEERADAGGRTPSAAGNGGAESDEQPDRVTSRC